MTEISNRDLNRWMLTVSSMVGECIDALHQAGNEADESIPAYRDRYAELYEALPDDMSVAARDRHVKNELAAERSRRDAAERWLRIHEKTLEARTKQMNMLQSVASSVREETKFDRTGPQGVSDGA